MRITGGKYGSRVIQCPKGIIRPAMDRMRESMFSILGDIQELRFLDCFSGSGLVGIEAASRGASPVVLVEKDRIKRDVILKNIEFVNEDISLKLMSVQKFLHINQEPFDIIFLDPPFPMSGKSKIIELISEKKALAVNGRLLIHHPQEDKLDNEIANFVLIDERHYGRSILKFYKWK